MNPRYCLNCRRWERDPEDNAIGICELGEVRLPFSRLRFQFEMCDCGMYVFKEHRQIHHETKQRMIVKMEGVR